MKVEIVIPVPKTSHPMLQDCIANIRETTGLEPTVVDKGKNVAIARNLATKQSKADWICFVDTDAFPQGKGWIDKMIDTGEIYKASIVSPNEILVFDGNSQHVLCSRTGRFLKNPDDQPAVAGMCLLVRRGCGTWDENAGLSNGYIGPCIEDTDFAYSIKAEGGIHAIDARVDVLHKDRGASSLKEWSMTDEFLAYQIMAILIDRKWKVHDRDFFKGLKKVQAADNKGGRGSRYMADGKTIEDLMRAYEKIFDKLPDADSIKNKMLHRMESIVEYRECKLRR